MLSPSRGRFSFPLSAAQEEHEKQGGEHGQDVNWSESTGVVAFLTGPAWLLQRVTLPPKGLSEAVPFLDLTIAEASA